jgi:hypothetical protein
VTVDDGTGEVSSNGRHRTVLTAGINRRGEILMGVG